MVNYKKIFRKSLFETNINMLSHFLMHNPTTKFTQAALRKNTGLSKVTVIEYLKELLELDYIKAEQIGRTKLYIANLSNPLLRQMKVLINMAEICGIAKQIAKDFECEVYLFGSSARGEDTEQSDIDLLIIGDRAPKNVLIAKLVQTEKKLGRKISPQIFTRLEWAQAARKDRPFYERVEKDKIRLA